MTLFRKILFTMIIGFMIAQSADHPGLFAARLERLQKGTELPAQTDPPARTARSAADEEYYQKYHPYVDAWIWELERSWRKLERKIAHSPDAKNEKLERDERQRKYRINELKAMVRKLKELIQKRMAAEDAQKLQFNFGIVREIDQIKSEIEENRQRLMKTLHDIKAELDAERNAQQEKQEEETLCKKRELDQMVAKIKEKNPDIVALTKRKAQLELMNNEETAAEYQELVKKLAMIKHNVTVLCMHLCNGEEGKAFQVKQHLKEEYDVDFNKI